MKQEHDLSAALFPLKDTSFGTLWQVADALWQKETFCDSLHERGESRPAVSILPETSPAAEIVPMLLGVDAPSAETLPLQMADAQKKLFYFGALKPVSFLSSFFLSDGIRENPGKKCLSEEEKETLRNFLRRKLQ